jgi:hypothetical protein
MGEIKSTIRAVVLSGSSFTLDGVATSQREPPGLRDRDVHVFDARQVPTRTEEAVALLPQIEKAANRYELALPCNFLTATLRLLTATLAVTSATTAPAAVARLALAALHALATLAALHALAALAALIAPTGLQVLRLTLRAVRGRHVAGRPIKRLGTGSDAGSHVRCALIGPELC